MKRRISALLFSQLLVDRAGSSSYKASPRGRDERGDGIVSPENNLRSVSSGSERGDPLASHALDALLEKKRDLASRVVGTGEGWITEMDDVSLRELVSLSKNATVVAEGDA